MAEHADTGAESRRLGRLAEELGELGFGLDPDSTRDTQLLAEIDYALRPAVHERRVPSFGAIIEPDREPSEWAAPTQLSITRTPIDRISLAGSRLFADGMSSWLVRRSQGEDELVVFDRSAGSERDLVILAESTGATLVQRHPAGLIRTVGEFGVLRWDGVAWHLEPPVDDWIDSVMTCSANGNRIVLETLLEFAVHDLGSRGIGAILIYRPADDPGPNYQTRLPVPPPLDICRPADLAPLRHVLLQIDGAAVFDAGGILRQLGVRLVPSPQAIADVDGYRGMRHTSSRRYSFDDAEATVIVISEDGPVTVLRGGELIGTSDSLRGAVDFDDSTGELVLDGGDNGSGGWPPQVSDEPDPAL